MSVIASGPTAPDPTTYEDAIRVLYANGLWHDVPGSIREHFVDGAERGQPETPGPTADCFERTTNLQPSTS
jgi:hydroxypyruvate reductase